MPKQYGRSHPREQRKHEVTIPTFGAKLHPRSRFLNNVRRRQLRSLARSLTRTRERPRPVFAPNSS